MDKINQRRTEMYKQGISSTAAHDRRLSVPISRRQKKRQRALLELRQALSPSSVKTYTPPAAQRQAHGANTNGAAIVPFPSPSTQHYLTEQLRCLFNPTSTPGALQQCTHRLSGLAANMHVAHTLASYNNSGSSSSVLDHLLYLLTAQGATEAVHFIPTMDLFNTLLQHESPGCMLTQSIVQHGHEQFFVHYLLHNNVTDVAMASVLALLNMASHDSTRSSIRTSIQRTKGAIDALRSLLVNPQVVGSQDLVLWLLFNLLIAMKEDDPQFEQSQQMVYHKSFAKMLPELMHIAVQRPPMAPMAPMAPTTPLPTPPQNITFSTSSSSSSSPSSSSSFTTTTSTLMTTATSNAQIKAIALVEQIVKHGGMPLEHLVNKCQRGMVTQLVLQAINVSDSIPYLHSVLLILTHIFAHCNDPLPIQEAIHNGALSILSNLLMHHSSTDIRYQAAHALSKFIEGTVDVVKPALLHSQCPVFRTLAQKSASNGDIAQEVREQSAYAMLQILRCAWVTDQMASFVLSSCVDLIHEMTSPPLLCEVLDWIEQLLSRSNVAHPQFEALGGIDAMEKLLYATKATPEVEAKIVHILNIVERHEQGNGEDDYEEVGMELEDIQPLTAVFQMVDGNGRLW